MKSYKLIAGLVVVALFVGAPYWVIIINWVWKNMEGRF